MAKKFTIKNSPAIIAAEKAIANHEEQDALANINWRKRLHLMPWQTFANVSLPDEYFKSQLAKIDKLQTFIKSYYQTFCDLLALSSDYDASSQDCLQITRKISIKYFIEDGRMSPLFPTLVSSLLNIAKADARKKKTKTMKEWKGAIDLLTEDMLPRDENKIQFSAENNSLRGEICELKDKLNEIEKTNKHNMIKTYTFSRKKDKDDIERLQTLKRMMEEDDDNEVTVRVDPDEKDESDDDHIIIPNRGEITDNFYSELTGDRDILKKKSHVINQQRIIKSIRESSDTPLKKLTDLIASTAYDYTSGSADTRFAFANLGKKFRDNSASTAIVDAILIFAETEAKIGVTRTVRQWYDTITSVADKMQQISDEKSQLKAENFSLKNKVRELEEQLSAAKKRSSLKQEEIVRLRNQVFVLQNQQLSPGVIFDMLPNDEAYKKKEKALEDKIKNLQDELGNESVPLSVLAEGLKDYVAEAGISKAQELFERLCYILLNVPAWTKNAPGLKTFFKKARKEMEGRNITMTGEHATYNENNKE